jgi:diguanylate cyclase (GGDEF)-like protein/PAS domain S-box-containing protein
MTAGAARTGTLLVVDDNEANRDALSRRLALKGYQVRVASGGAEALRLIAAEPFDLVLLDVEMPSVSGFDVLAALRASWSRTELPVIMVTARADGADIVEAFRLGANDYVTKPIDFPVAVARIATHLSHKWTVGALRESEERYALSVHGANDGLWDWNLTTNEVYWSPRWKAMLGYAADELGTNPDEWLTRVHRDDAARVASGLQAHLAHGSGHYESEHRLLHRDGTFRWVLCRGAAVRNAEGRATRLAGSLTDITDAKVSDALTGLPNRLMFVDLVDRALDRAHRRPGYAFALVMLGLDRFKDVVNSLGPLAADRLLVSVARRFQSALRVADGAGLRPGTMCTLARLSGDEFTLLLDDLVDETDAVRIVDRLRAALDQPFDLDGHQLFASAVAGIAVSTAKYDRAEEMLRDAATALHRAKVDRASRCELFDPAMRDRAVARLQVETDLRRAVDDESFTVEYQPIVALATGRLAAFEALVRWRHPVRGIVAPDQFIAVAEETGMILPIGHLALAESCRQMAEWQRTFGAAAPAAICVNMSSRQFVDAGFALRVEEVLRDAGLDAPRLSLEITESAFIGDVETARATVNRLRAIGVEWSIDDFGTGYSSLSHLHRLHFDTLKIDRSFVARIGAEEGGLEMVRAIIALAHSLGMDVVAEGVETEEQLVALRRLGCQYAQGFFLSRPVGVVEAEGLIASKPWSASAA